MTINSNWNIKQRLDKKYNLLFSICIVMLLVLVGCGYGDYEYRLPNGFRICRANSETITLNAEKCIYEYTDEDGLKGLSSFAVESYVHEFSYNEQYVAVKQFNPENLDFQNFDSNDFSTPTYYFVDTVSTTVYGPYETQEEFEFACKEMNVGELGEWISTRSNPNDRTNK